MNNQDQINFNSTETMQLDARSHPHEHLENRDSTNYDRPPPQLFRELGSEILSFLFSNVQDDHQGIGDQEI